MVGNYRTMTLSAEANENLVPKIYKLLTESGNYTTPRFFLDFVGFEANAGTSFKINDNPLKVPSTGKFITPYGGESNHIVIHSLTFDQAISNMDFWVIF